jgi:hypothetical protein
MGFCAGLCTLAMCNGTYPFEQVTQKGMCALWPFGLADRVWESSPPRERHLLGLTCVREGVTREAESKKPRVSQGAIRGFRASLSR